VFHWEEKMRRSLTFLLTGLLILVATLPAAAWEFGLKGEYEYRYRYIGRMGNTDLFGVAPLQDTAVIANTAGFVNAFGLAPGETNLVGFAGPTVYNRGMVPAWNSDSSNVGDGGRPRSYFFPGTTIPLGVGAGGPPLMITRGGYSRSGPDAFINDMRLTLYPEIRVNSAVRIFGVYNVGGYRNKYFQNGTPGIPNSFGGLPILGDAALGGVGVPPFERYYMSQTSMNAYDTAAIGSWEQFRATLQLPWGVLSIGVKDFPFGVGATLANNTRAEELLLVVPYGPFRFIYGIWLARGRFAESWTTSPDSDHKNNLFTGGAFTYDVADLSLGYITIWRQYHQKALDSGNSGLLGLPVNGLDDNTFVNLAFMKYFNGRFFANVEYSWVNDDQYRIGNPPMLDGNIPIINSANLHVEAYHLFAELGTVCGPTKLSFLYALSSGRVLNNNNITKAYAPFAINYQVMQPYQYLMFDTFAGGNNGGWNPLDITFVADEHGMMTDAYAYAARMDYAVAANLNVWGSYIWAHRLERAGSLAGGIASSGGPPPFGWTVAQAQAWKALNTGGAAAGLNPYVDNGYLGWEANVGVDWKLLEGVTSYFRYSYWQPGDWFTQAYQAVGMRGGAAVNDGLISGRDPIQAFTGTLMINF
jgi:hypothetical protein